MSDLYRGLPAVDALLRDPRLADLPRPIALAAARAELAALRAEIGAGSLTALPDVAERVAVAARGLAPRLRRVINATGVVVHTNLGRAPWAPEAIEAAIEAAGACDLELDLETGRRGGRLAGVSARLRLLTGAEACLVVNNNAAAVLLALTALASGREVVASRGELVEIGGSFRVPDVIASCGATLREVGTTNRTRIDDYAGAIGERTGALLEVHPSNFRIDGFTESPGRAALARLADATGVPLVVDLGSGALVPVAGEPTVADALRDGAHLVAFSGDKLLGGPQAGLIVGRAALVDRLARHPLYRALRVDKVTLAALEATLSLYVEGRVPPVVARILAPAAELEARAERLLAGLVAAGVAAERVEQDAAVGGGALPGVPLPGPAVALPGPADALARALRLGAPPVVGRIAEQRVRLDVRTVDDGELPALIAAVVDAIGRRDKEAG